MIAYWLFIFLIVNNSIGNNRIRVFLQYIFMLTALGFYYYHYPQKTFSPKRCIILVLICGLILGP